MDTSSWAGAAGEAWASEWRRTDRSFAPVDAALVETAAALAPAHAGVRVLDIGCGAGTTAMALAARLEAPRILGLDISPAQIARAGERAAAAGYGAPPSDGAAPVARSAGEAAGTPPTGAGSCAFLVADAARWAGSESFDLVVSRHGLMFFDDPAAALAHIRSLAAPGAPLVFSCFRDAALNPWASEPRALLASAPRGPHAPGPFAFADRDRVAGLLEGAGFRDARAEPLDYAYVAGEGTDAAEDAIGFFTRIGPAAEALRTAPAETRPRVAEGIAAIVARYHRDGRVAFPAAAWIWTARA